MKSRIIALGALSLCAAACSGAGDTDAEADEGAVEIQPTGNDAPGKLVVTAPGAVDPTKVVVGQKTVALGASIDDLKVGAADFRMNTEGGNYGFTSSGQATITSGQTTTVKAGSLAIKAVGGPRTLGLGPDLTNWAIRLTKTPDPRYGVTGNRTEGGVKPTSDGSAAAPVLAADYEVNFGLGAMDGVAVKIDSGQAQTVTLTDPATRSITRVKAPPVRALPDAACGGAARSYQLSVPGRGAIATISSSFTLADGESIEIGLSQKNKDGTYQFGNANWSVTVPVPKGRPGAGAVDWSLGRIDVHDVKVNGTQTVKGKYRVIPTQAIPNLPNGQSLLGCDPPTATGVDVPPGTYKVEIRYSTAEAGEKVDTHVVTVPP